MACSLVFPGARLCVSLAMKMSFSLIQVCALMIFFSHLRFREIPMIYFLRNGYVKDIHYQ